MKVCERCDAPVLPSGRAHIDERKRFCSRRCQVKAAKRRAGPPKNKNHGSREAAYARHEKWRARNKVKFQSYFQRWVRTERGAALHNISIAKWKGSDSALFFQNRYRLIIVERRPCAACDAPYQTKQGFAVDHIVARRLGGTHEMSNLQILCRPCHIHKTILDNQLIRASKTEPG